MDRKPRRRILIFLAVVGVLAYGLLELSGRRSMPNISAVEVMRRNLVSVISSNGKVEPIAPYVIRAGLDAYVVAVHAMEGQQAKKGQMLIELNVKDVLPKLAEARSALLRAEDDLRAAKAGGRSDEAARIVGAMANAIAERDRLQRNHDALQKLVAEQAAMQEELAANDLKLVQARTQVTQLTAAKAEFERGVKLNAERAALEVEQRRNVVAALEEQVRNERIRAPIDGTLYSLPVKNGDYVKEGQPLAELADLREVRVRAFIDEPDLGTLEPNESVKITWDALPNKSWAAKTDIIPKQVIARGRRSVGELVCLVNNDRLELLPNVNVNVHVNVRERLGVLSVARGAVQVQDERRYVFVVKGNQLGVEKSTLEKREIKVGIADVTSYEVTSGLQEGEMVALPGDLDLRDGMKVYVVNAEMGNQRGTRD
jgi:HlyD family secretion protein